MAMKGMPMKGVRREANMAVEANPVPKFTEKQVLTWLQNFLVKYLQDNRTREEKSAKELRFFEGYLGAIGDLAEELREHGITFDKV